MPIKLPYYRALVAGMTLLVGAGWSAFAAALNDDDEFDDYGITERVSIAGAQREGDMASYGPTSISADGRYVAFVSEASNLYPQDTNGVADIFVRDRVRGITRYISMGNPLSPTGQYEISDGPSLHPSISGDGQRVAYASDATNLVANDTNNHRDIFVRGLFGRNLRVSVSSNGTQANGDSQRPQISQDGSAIVYSSEATNLVPGDTNNEIDVFITRIGVNFSGTLAVQSTQRVSVARDGSEGDGPSDYASVSANGRYVAFQSEATNLVDDDTNDASDIFVKDMFTGRIVRASTDVDGMEADGDSFFPAISANGRYVAFISSATNLVDDDTNDMEDVFVKDLVTGEIERVSVSDSGEEGDGPSGDPLLVSPWMPDSSPVTPAISGDGRLVAFVSEATNLVDDDTNDEPDVFVRDRFDMTTYRVSVSTYDEEGDGPSLAPSLSAQGNLVAFMSDATNLVDDDTNGVTDVFVRSLKSFGGGDLDNSPPDIVLAAYDIEAFEGEQVVLDASATTDPDGDPLTFHWRQLPPDYPDDEWYPVVLNSPDSAITTFTAPLVSNYVELEFEVSVSDGVNPPQKEIVTVTVNYAPPAIVSGRVTDSGGNPVANASVEIVRDDGELASQAYSDKNGYYSVPDVRVGPNTAVVRAGKFELITRRFVAESATPLELNFQFVQQSARLIGNIYLSNGQPLANASVQYLSKDGDILAEALTDSRGTYVLDSLDSATLAEGQAVRIEKAPLPDWIDTGVRIAPGGVTRRDYRYGNLIVAVDAKPKKLQKKLPGTVVEVWIGSELIAENEIGKKKRRVEFDNVPSTGMLVRAYNDELTGAQKDVLVKPGRTKNPVKLTLLRRDIF